ncbi:MAG: PGF-pre-PGF domain-containing protein [DPANN group archaeon]|nr:PGF-pre-PGF domain-containing protein [DPANN group archaeon]
MAKRTIAGLFFVLILVAMISAVNAELLTSASINITAFPNVFGAGILADANPKAESTRFNVTAFVTPGEILTSLERNVTIGFTLFPPVIVEHPIPEAPAAASTTGGQSGAAAGSGGAGGLGLIGIQTAAVSTIAASAPSSVAFAPNPSQISNLEFVLAEPASNVQVIVAEVKELGVPPVTNSIPGTDTVYKHIQIELRNVRPAAVKDAKVHFSVDQSWLSGKGIAKESVTLYRYENGWKALSTSFERDDGKVSRYVAKSPGFSTFAIVGKKASATAASVPVIEKEGPAQQEVQKGTQQEVKSAPAFPQYTIGWQAAAAASVIFVIIGIVLMQTIRHKKRRR